MATLTSFMRPADPIVADSLGSQISAAVGIACTAEIRSLTEVWVTGPITETNRVAIQAAITAYVYPLIPTSYLTTSDMSSDTPMTANRTSKVVSEYAAYQGDLLTRRKNWVSGVLKNDSLLYNSKASTAGGSGVVTFYITSDGTSGGTAVFANVYADSIIVAPYGSGGQYQAYSPTVAGDKKSITATIAQATNVLGILTFNATAANGIDCRLLVIGD